MQRLRQARMLARLVLAWFALTVGAAIAAPLVQPKAVQLVCAGAGSVRLLLQDGDEPPASPTLDCPLCLAVAPPLPAAAAGLLLPSHHEPVLPQAWAPPAARRGSPPARGPPLA